MAGKGAFGKLPQRGDFIAHRLSAGFTDPWHAWLSDGLALCRARLGQRFVAVFLEAPVWRFALQPGRCGPEAAAGILMPSVDRAERLFPLTLGATHPEPLDLAGLLRAGGWFEMLEAHARAVLEDGVSLPDWLAALDGLAPMPEAASAAATGWAPLADGEEIADEPIATALLRRGQRGACLFWSRGSPFVRPAFFLGDGLPEGADFARLLADPSAEDSGEAAA
jgi:type VI secretion system protein ImpM